MSPSRAASARASRTTRPRSCRSLPGGSGPELRKPRTSPPAVSATFPQLFPSPHSRPFMTRVLAAIASVLFLISGNALSQQKFEPQVGQAGKDVIWVPTPDDVVERMLTNAQVTPNDLV